MDFGILSIGTAIGFLSIGGIGIAAIILGIHHQSKRNKNIIGTKEEVLDEITEDDLKYVSYSAKYRIKDERLEKLLDDTVKDYTKDSGYKQDLLT